MIYTITLRDENGNEISRYYHEAVFEGDFLLDELNSIKDTLEDKEIRF